MDVVATGGHSDQSRWQFTKRYSPVLTRSVFLAWLINKIIVLKSRRR